MGGEEKRAIKRGNLIRDKAKRCLRTKKRERSKKLLERHFHFRDTLNFKGRGGNESEKKNFSGLSTGSFQAAISRKKKNGQREEERKKYRVTKG